jgi:hypothetical protein
MILILQAVMRELGHAPWPGFEVYAFVVKNKYLGGGVHGQEDIMGAARIVT